MSESTDKSRPPCVKPEVYEIRVRGILYPCWSEWFEGFSMVCSESGETILSGAIIDQAALHGTLAKIRDLNLELISVTRLDPGTLHKEKE